MKIDEITNLGAVKIRLRSLMEALNQEGSQNNMKDYTILVPDMCPIHFSLIKYVFDEYGYKIEF